MYSIRFRESVRRQLKKLPSDIQERIIKKLEFYAKTDKPLQFAERLTNVLVGHYRFRIGDYRVIVDVIDITIMVIEIGHRREIYK